MSTPDLDRMVAAELDRLSAKYPPPWVDARGSEEEDMSETSQQADTMTVTVRDRSGEAPWGVGLTQPVTRKVTISAFCPKCGQQRGEPRGLNQCDDGAFYWVQVWDNPCGHADMYEDVIKEARERGGLGAGRTH